MGTCDGFICVFWEAGSIATVVKMHLSTSGTIALINNTIYFLPSKKKFEGLENLPPPDTPAVYVSNHQSFLDIYTLLTLGRSFKFISKTGIFLFPIIGWAMFLLGIIPLKRMDSRSQLVFLHYYYYYN